MGDNKDGSRIKYRSATEEDIQTLLPLNAQAVEYRNLEQVKERQERERQDAAKIARKVLPNLDALLTRAPSPEAPTPITQPPPPAIATVA